MNPLRLPLISGLALIVLGLTVIAGWISQRPALIRLVPGFDGMPWTTALGFVLTGVALVSMCAELQAPPVRRRLSDLLAAALILLAAAALAETMGLASFGLAPNNGEPLPWFNDGSPYSGRIRPVAAVGLFAIGLDLLLIPRTSSPLARYLASLLTLVVMVVALLALAAPLIVGHEIYTWVIGPVYLAGICFALSAGALFVLQQATDTARRELRGDGEPRISLTASGIVIMTGMLGAIGGFGILYPQASGDRQEELRSSLRQHSSALERAIRTSWREANAFAIQPLHINTMHHLVRDPADGPSRATMREIAASYAAFGFTALRFLDRSGVEIARAGAFAPKDALSGAIHMPSPALLMWDGGYLLHTRIAMVRNGKVVGAIEAERRLPAPDEAQDLDYSANAPMFRVCAADKDAMVCFPASGNGQAIYTLPRNGVGRTHPVSHALDGKSGIVKTTDARDAEVIVAYAPIGDLRLGASIEVNAAEYYHPVANKIWALTLFLVALAALSILLLRVQLVPLVRKVTREVEERKAAELKLQFSEARLAEIAATLGEGVYVLDADGLITFVNPEAERLLGWTAAELIGESAHHLFHHHRADGEPMELDECPVHRSTSAGRLYRSDQEWMVRRDGRVIPVALSASPLVRDGRVEGSVTSFEDIRARKEVEQELNKYRNRLEELVEERTSDLLKLNRELEAFSYSVSHDLRAPLRAINGFTGALREEYGDRLPADAHDYFDRVQRATVRMGELVDGLLNLSHVVRSELNISPVDLTQIATSIANALRDGEPQRRAEFLIEPGLTAAGDPALLRVLLENLLGNAWKFTRGRSDERIEFGRAASLSGQVFQVRDNGAGFDMQFAHKLFQPFERLHKHNEFPGNGIGLATVRRIVERHGGRVWAQSSVGVGTTIYFTIRSEGKSAQRGVAR